MTYQPHTDGPFGPTDLNQPSQTAPYPTGPQPQPGSSIAALGRIVQVVLAASALAAVYRLFAVLNEHSVAGNLLDHTGSVTLSQARNADSALTDRGRIELAILALTALMFLVWFWRARSNAGGFAPDGHRRARAWAFWGWVCPVVALWFPYQIATDTLRASEQPGFGRPGNPGGYGLLRAWWSSLLLCAVLNRAVAAHPSDTLNDLRGRLEIDAVSGVAQVVAAVLAIAVVGRITASNERRRAQLLGPAWRL